MDIPTQPKYSIVWDEKEQLIRSSYRGYFSKEDAEHCSADILALAKEKGGNVNTLNDMRKATGASMEARLVFARLAKAPEFNKQAFFGQGHFINTILTLVMDVAGATKTKFFSTEAEALKWLKEE